MAGGQVLAAKAALAGWVQKCRDNFTEFAKAAGRNEEGNRIDLAAMHLSWHRHLDYCWSTGKHCMILAHFGSGKSSSFACPLISWLVGNDVQRRVKIISNGDDQAARRVASVKRLMESPVYKQIFSNVEPGHKWTEHAIYVKRKGFSIDPTIESRGVFTVGIGSRADVLIFDDVVDQKNSEEPAQRRRVQELVDQTWMTRLEPGRGLVLWIATPWRLDDATHQLMRRPGWCTLVQKVSEDFSCIEQEVIGAGDAYPVEP